MSRYLIVGASGFIGQAVYRGIVDQGLSAIALPHSGELDLCDPHNAQALSEYTDRSIVVHAAGIPRLVSDEFGALQRNLQISDTLLKACSVKPPERIIFLSSVEVYGYPETLAVTENTAISPITNYGIGKATAELMLKRWCADCRVPLVCFRLPGIFGPNDRGRGFIGSLAECIATKSRFRLTANRESLRDYVYVEDIARAVMEISPRISGQVVLNLASGISYTLDEIMVIMQQVVGSFDIDDQSKEAPVQHIKFDNTKLRRFAPEYEFIELEQALKNYVRD